jgi:hypothetical protein
MIGFYAGNNFTGTGLLWWDHLVEHQHAETGAGGGTRTESGDFFKIRYSAITTSPPEANSLITNEGQRFGKFIQRFGG